MKKDGLLFVGLGVDFQKEIKSYFSGGVNFRLLEDSDAFYNDLEVEHAHQPYAVFVGSAISDLPAIDVAQSYRVTFPDTKIIYVGTQNESFEHKNLTKNGFYESLMLPLDQLFLKKLCNDLAAEMDMTEKVFKEIQLCDLEAGLQLEFGTYVYMPLNRKFVKISNPGQAIDQRRLNMLQKKAYATIHIEAGDLSKFYDLVAQRLSALSTANDRMSETERQERLKKNVRGLILSIFDSTDTASFSDGNAIVDNCRHIVEEYVNSKVGGKIYSRFLRMVGEDGDIYAHTSRVSVYATLFAMITGVCKPEDVGIAGLFHDLGKTTLPSEILNKPYEQMGRDEKDIYEKHPEEALDVIAQKRINLDVVLKKAITQHHERVDGSGYPKKLIGHVISVEAQIIGIADTFDHLTSVTEGRPRLDPVGAIEEMIKSRQFDNGFLEKIHAVLKQDAEELAA